MTSGVGFTGEIERSGRCSESLRARGLVRPDLMLVGTAESYSSGELWCYIHHLWVHNKGRCPTLDAMAEDGVFSKERAVDVVLATLSNAGHTSPPTGLLPSHLFSFLQIITTTR